MERVSSSGFLSGEAFQVKSDGFGGQFGLIWEQTKAPLIVPLLRISVFICLAMSLMLLFEKVYMGVVILLVKLFGKKPEKRYKWEPLKEDLELANANHPMVLVQIPMYNEREVYQLSIGAACGLSWPSDRIIIQVLDDSTDPFIKNLVEMECQRWRSKGVNIKYEIRDNRNGYKAGALKEGMKRSYVKECDYVAIFDADFQPESDFLWRTIPFLVHNNEIALVQARWKFGTAGVWRIAALNEAGGWKDRTTVEDMDLAVRASLKGWKFVYLADLKVKNELPSTFKAYRYQQHRWSCGPANLFRKMASDILNNKEDSGPHRHLLLLLRGVAGDGVVPGGPRTQVGLRLRPHHHHSPQRRRYPKNVMSLHRTKATFIGLLEVGRVNEWVVTEKLGDGAGVKSNTIGPILKSTSKKPSRLRMSERVHTSEIAVGAYLLMCGFYDMAYGRNRYFIYLFLQSFAFFVAGFGFIGTFVPTP
ncbi:hypothetical protein V2J09_008251 [Rumex salicifolius]